MTETDDYSRWPSTAYEELPWHRDLDELRLLSKTARRRIGSTYRSSLPLHIAARPVDIPRDRQLRLEDLTARLARFDEQQALRGYDLPSLLLRSESAASSQIEHLTSSARNVALAELSDDAPHNALLIAGNLAAMRRALTMPGTLSLSDIQAVHKALLERDDYAVSYGGVLRDEPVWIGGTAFSPHGALYVPPRSDLVPAYLDDLVDFAARQDVGPIAKASIVHAQFESIHPFIDGNGRTGRAILHGLLRNEGVLTHATLPVSAGLLHNIDAYMDALSSYHEGDYIAVIDQVIEALDLALAIGEVVAERIDGVFEGWSDRMSERAGSSILRLPAVLVGQPVVTIAYVAERLGITSRAAASVVDRACTYGMLRRFGNRHRGAFYQADELIDILEEISSMVGIRRILAYGGRGGA